MIKLSLFSKRFAPCGPKVNVELTVGNLELIEHALRLAVTHVDEQCHEEFVDLFNETKEVVNEAHQQQLASLPKKEFVMTDEIRADLKVIADRLRASTPKSEK